MCRLNAQRPFDHGPDFGHVERLHHVLERPFVDRIDGGGQIPECRDHDDRCVVNLPAICLDRG